MLHATINAIINNEEPSTPVASFPIATIPSTLPMKRYADDSTSESEESTSESDNSSSESENSSSSEDQEKPKKRRKLKDASFDEEDIQFLPESIADLRARVEDLIQQFVDGKLDNRNEIVYILDELKRRGNIDGKGYQKINDYLSAKQGSPRFQFLGESIADLRTRVWDLIVKFIDGELKDRDEIDAIIDELKLRGSLSDTDYQNVHYHLQHGGSGLTDKEREDEEEEVMRKDDIIDQISDTIAYRIKFDRKEIEELLKLFQKEGGAYWEDDILNLRQLVYSWIEHQILGTHATLEVIKSLLTKMGEDSKISKTKLARFEWILNDMIENKEQVTLALTCMALYLNKENPSSKEEQLGGLKTLVKSQTITEEQFEALKEKLEQGEIGLNMDDVIEELKRVKAGRGEKCLPNVNKDLLSKLYQALARYPEEKTNDLKMKLIAYLEELLQRKAITKRDYQEKIEQHDLNNMAFSNHI